MTERKMEFNDNNKGNGVKFHELDIIKNVKAKVHSSEKNILLPKGTVGTLTITGPTKKEGSWKTTICPKCKKDKIFWDGGNRSEHSCECGGVLRT